VLVEGIGVNECVVQPFEEVRDVVSLERIFQCTKKIGHVYMQSTQLWK
jgi:hypothetical protein